MRSLSSLPALGKTPNTPMLPVMVLGWAKMWSAAQLM